MTYLGIITVSVIFSVLFAKYDAARISIKSYKGDKTNLDHNFRTVVRVVFGLAVGHIDGNIFAALVSISAFYLVFDLFMNIERGKNIFYLGHTSKVDRFLVNLFKEDVNKAGKAMFIFEFAMFCLFSLAYFYL